MQKHIEAYLKEGQSNETIFAFDYLSFIKEKQKKQADFYFELLKFKGIMEFLTKNNSFDGNFKDSFESIYSELLTCTNATKFQDMHEHWDVKILNHKIDVKGLRKLKQTDEKHNEDIHWVELKNVAGKLGWLYGEADFFAFELSSCWVLVSKEKLQSLVKEKCSKEFVTEPTLYKMYQRNGRADMITLVKSLDLCKISDEIIPKQK